MPHFKPYDWRENSLDPRDRDNGIRPWNKTGQEALDEAIALRRIATQTTSGNTAVRSDRPAKRQDPLPDFNERRFVRQVRLLQQEEDEMKRLNERKPRNKSLLYAAVAVALLYFIFRKKKK